MKCYAVQNDLAADEAQNLFDSVVYVDLGLLRSRPLGECCKPSNHIPCAPGLTLDTDQALSHLIEIRLVALQPPKTGGGLRRDCADGLVDLMGDRRGEFTHRRQPRDMCEVCLRIAKRLRGLLPTRNVHRDQAK